MGKPSEPGRTVRLPIAERIALGMPPEELLAELEILCKIAELPGFRDDLYTQGKAASLTAECWNFLSREQQEKYVSTFSENITRCREDPRPQDCFNKIVSLTKEEDIRRAVMVPAKPEQPFKPELGETLYPTEGWIGDYLKYSYHNEVPLAFHFWSAIAMLGALCHRNFYVEMGLFRIYMNNYVMLTGTQASGKSVAKDVAVDVLKRYNRGLEIYNDKDPRIVNILPEDITAEALLTEMASRLVSGVDTANRREVLSKSDATALFPIDELANFLTKDAWAVKKKIPLLTALWSYEGRYGKATKKDGLEELWNIALSILTCCAPDWFKENITDDVRKGGFMDRALFIHREPSNRCYPWPHPLDPIEAESLARSLRDRMDQRSKVIIRAEHDANQWYENWYRAASKEERQQTSANPGVRTVKRQAIHLWKLAGLLSIAYGEFPEIKKQRMVEAQRIIQHEEQYLALLLDLIDERPDAPVWDKLVRFVDVQEGCVTKTEITQRFKRTIGNSKVIGRYLDTLVEDGSLRASKGRPIIYFLPDHEDCKKCGPKLVAVKLGEK